MITTLTECHNPKCKFCGGTGVIISKSETTMQVFKNHCYGGTMDGMPYETINYPESAKYFENMEQQNLKPRWTPESKLLFMFTLYLIKQLKVYQYQPFRLHDFIDDYLDGNDPELGSIIQLSSPESTKDNNNPFSNIDQYLHDFISELSSLENDEVNGIAIKAIIGHLETAHALIHNNINYTAHRDEVASWWASLTCDQANEIYYRHFPYRKRVLLAEPVDWEKDFLFEQECHQFKRKV